MKNMALILCLIIAAPAWAAPRRPATILTGQVIYVVDGDTLDFAELGKQTIRVRLADVDAPERKQPFGPEARDSLRNICDAAPAQVSATKIDRYGRTIGHVTCRNVDASRYQVSAGMAWVYVQYAPKQSPLYAVQAKARAAHIGLWADPQPVAPWVFRHGDAK